MRDGPPRTASRPLRGPCGAGLWPGLDPNRSRPQAASIGARRKNGRVPLLRSLGCGGAMRDTGRVPKRDAGPLAAIEQDLLDDSKPLAATLRKCLTLGGQLKSVALREWASRELNGYRGDSAELPDYRKIAAPILLDGVAGFNLVKRQRISPNDLPDFVAEKIGEIVDVRDGVGLLEDLVKRSDASGDGAIKISLPMAADIASVMNRRGDDDVYQIMDLYWGVSVSSIQGVLDRVRTAVVELVSELRAGMPDDVDTPSPEMAEQAVNVVLHGGKRNQVTVMTSKADNGGSASITPNSDKPDSWWTKTSAIWTVVGVLVAVVGVYVAYRQLRE
jgi:hypothetical protein